MSHGISAGKHKFCSCGLVASPLLTLPLSNASLHHDGKQINAKLPHMGVTVEAVRAKFVHLQKCVGAGVTGAAVLYVVDVVVIVGGADDVHFMSVLSDQDSAAGLQNY